MIEKKLYAALKRLAAEYKGLADSGDSGNWAAEEEPNYIDAMAAIKDFEEEQEPLPHWALGYNFDEAVMVGAQLFTRDGRVIGNAKVILYSENDAWIIQTEAGNKTTLNTVEIMNRFWIGPYLLPIKIGVI